MIFTIILSRRKKKPFSDGQDDGSPVGVAQVPVDALDAEDGRYVLYIQNDPIVMLHDCCSKCSGG